MRLHTALLLLLTSCFSPTGASPMSAGMSEAETSTTSDATSGATSGTTSDAVCGNGVAELAEECDGVDLKGATCHPNFPEGVLACGADCTLFTTGCYRCGDGAKNMAEACDGSNLGGKSCQILGFSGGNLVCSPDCKSFDTSGCLPLPSCGNAVKEGNEQCDGAQFDGQTCASLGFDRGTLQCSAMCVFDTTNCTVLDCAGQGEPCTVDENNPQSNCCPPGVKGNVLGICDVVICF